MRRVLLALVLGGLAVTAVPASATCYVGNIDICHKPTDPYTRPVTDKVNQQVYNVEHNPNVAPVIAKVVVVETIVANEYQVVLCTAHLSTYC